MIVKARVDQKDLASIKKALTNVSKEKTVQTRELPRKWSIDFAGRFRRAVASNKYESQVPRLTPKYKEWKRKKKKPLNPWKLEKNLLAMIANWRRDRNTWLAGVPRGIMGTKDTYIGKYAVLAEFGNTFFPGESGYQPPRPYMTPEFDIFVQSGADKEAMRSLNAIRQKWRK